MELLVVAAVLALLVALLLPALASARRTARRSVCQATLSQWAGAVVMYAETNHGYLPRRGQGVQPTALIDRVEDWFNALPPLMRIPRYMDLVATGRIPRPGERSSFVCPQATQASGTHFFAYAMNMRLSTWNAAKPDRIDRVAPPSVQVFLTDGPGEHCSVLPSPQAYSPVARHSQSVNIAFLDGHVTGFSGQYVGCGVRDPRRGDVRWVVPNSPWPGPAN